MAIVVPNPSHKTSAGAAEHPERGIAGFAELLLFGKCRRGCRSAGEQVSTLMKMKPTLLAAAALCGDMQQKFG